MNKVNQDIIKDLTRLFEIEQQQKKLKQEYKLLEDKIHLTFDSAKYDTVQAEKHIINKFWSRAYDDYLDGGYITNDQFIVDARFEYEKIIIQNLVNQNVSEYKTCLDIGCGNGRYTKFLSTTFSRCVGIDLSEQRIASNNSENKLKNVEYQCCDISNSSDLVTNGYDFIFVGDIFMYTHESVIDELFHKLLRLLSKNGFLLVRESTLLQGNDNYKSKNYVAYYRNYEFYCSNIFEKHFIKCKRNYAYNLYHLSKYFNVYQQHSKVLRNPLILENIVREYLANEVRAGHFFLYRK
ncbi:hypothetical protein EP12_05180 [Alteromonas australica]|nr:hypothetical protein EP12_05180 [Alteromonas australica]